MASCCWFTVDGRMGMNANGICLVISKSFTSIWQDICQRYTICIQQYIEGQFTAASVVPFNSSALSQAPSYSRLFLSVLVWEDMILCSLARFNEIILGLVLHWPLPTLNGLSCHPPRLTLRYSPLFSLKSFGVPELSEQWSSPCPCPSAFIPCMYSSKEISTGVKPSINLLKKLLIPDTFTAGFLLTSKVLVSPLTNALIWERHLQYGSVPTGMLPRQSVVHG